MAEADRDRWDARHEVVTGGLPAPPDALRGREHLLPDGGLALDVACGRGAVAVWLAERGFTVDAVDVSGRALAAGAAMAHRSGAQRLGAQRSVAAAGRVRWWRHDLDSGLPAACAGPYDVVVCQRFRDPELYPALLDRLRAGGLLVVSVLSEVGEDPGPYRARPGELLAAFGHLEVLAQHEGGGEASLLARSR